jgi:hypothetical protein
VFPEMHKNIAIFEGFYVSPAFSSVMRDANIIPPLLCTNFHYDFTFEGYKEFTFHRPNYKLQFVPRREHSMLPSARPMGVCCIEK